MSQSSPPGLSLIAATDENGLMGDANGIPWRLPREVEHFRQYTAGKWLLVGHRTYEEMHGWFHKDRLPLVLTTRCGWDPKEGRAVSSVPHALALAHSASQSELVCIGGGQTFAAALAYASLLVLTTVHARYTPGDRSVYFPSWDPAGWRAMRTAEFASEGKDKPAFTIHWWQKA